MIPIILLTLFLPFYVYVMVVHDYNNDGISVLECLMAIVVYIVGMVTAFIPFANYKFYKLIVYEHNMEFPDNRVEVFIVYKDAFDTAKDKIVEYLDTPIFKRKTK